MKVLSIRQPWASLIALGIKDIENRPWSTSYRGPLLVHAALKADCALRDVEQRLGVELPAIATPRGGIVGLTNIVDCVTNHASPWFSGPHGLVLSGSRELPFLPMKGFLRLRDAPASVLEHYGLATVGDRDL